MKDKKGIEIKLGDKITNGYSIYEVIEYKGQLYADNGGHMFPLESENVKVWEKFEVIG